LHYPFTRKCLVFSPQFNHNQLDHWGDVDLLQPAAGIKTVYFEANPIARDPQYRRKLKLALPSLTQIDATMVPRTN
jgi:protein phosphatase 1 regulatory subunit 7